MPWTGTRAFLHPLAHLVHHKSIFEETANYMSYSIGMDDMARVTCYNRLAKVEAYLVPDFMM
jgi:hypothetical protein